MTASRKRTAVIHGALLGAWWGLIFLALVRGTDHGWGLFASPPPGLDTAFGFESRILPMLARRWGVPFLANLYLAAATPIVAGAVLGLLCSLLAQWWKVDPDRHALRALREVATAWRFLLLSMLAVAAVASLGMLIEYWVASIVFAALAVAGAPFFVFNRPWLSEPRVSPFPRPAWPGWRVLVSFLFAWGVFAVLEKSFDALEHLTSGVIWWALDLLSSVASIVSGAWLTALWIDRMNLRQFWVRRPQFLSWGFLNAWVALEFWVFVAIAWIGAPLLAWTVTQVFVLPQLNEYMEVQGASLPAIVLWAMRASWWGWVLAFLLLPAFLATSGRLYVSLVPGPSERAPSTG